MREILFRGKMVDNGEWWFGSLITPKNLNKLYCIHNDIELPFYRGVTPETIGQYTGLTDKNGNKIFEGDIVKWSHTFLGEDRPYHIGRVAYKKAQFVVENRDVFAHCGTCSEPFGCACRMNDTNRDFEVIGNIYDNPELLEVEVV